MAQMTTIFADLKSGVMVCDSKCTYSEIWFEKTKVFKIGDELIGFSGYTAESEKWLAWYAAGQNGPSPKITNSNALILSATNLLMLDGSGGHTAIECGYMGVGTGGPCATAAYMAGASPEKAVQIACRIDANSGGAVVVHKLKGKK
jgi:ATP-dependent protease HslVU (ClpYQ) peptidase subunit